MAKKNKKTKGSDSEGKSNAMRKAGSAAAKLLENPVVLDLVSAALVAAAAAIADNKPARRTADGLADTGASKQKLQQARAALKLAAVAAGNELVKEIGKARARGKRSEDASA